MKKIKKNYCLYILTFGIISILFLLTILYGNLGNTSNYSVEKGIEYQPYINNFNKGFYRDIIAQDESTDEVKNVPEFYGLTKAIVQKNSSFDIKSAHLRIFARDIEDGDLTDKIKVVSNNVDPTNIGNYEINYEVIDSNNNITTITVPVEVVENDEGAYYERTVYSLPSVDHMAVTGPRGNAMDKQITGLMLRENSKINIKKVSGPDVTAQIYSTNAGTKKNTVLTNEWQEFTYSKISTVFIKTSFKVNGPTIIGINVPEDSDVIEMPYYHYKDNEEEFRAYWDSIEGSSVGVIENQSVLYYFLPQDKGLFRAFGSLDAGLEFFDNLITEYDELLGYEYVTEDSWDQNVKTKYFISGGGANNGALAYYSELQVTWAGSNTPTSNGFAAGWALLHEVAHGYQGGGLKEDGGMSLVEVSNNILGHYVQIRSKLADQVPGDWLGALPNIEDQMNEYRENGMTFRDLGPKPKLYVLVNLLEMYDYKKTYAYLASMVRELNYKGQGNKYNLAEKYTIAFHDLYGVNVGTYFESWGESISQNVKELVKNDKPVVMIKDVVDDNMAANEIKDDLGKSGKYSLVTTEEIEKYNLEGNVHLKLEITNFDDLKGKDIILYNGEKVYTEKITDEEIDFTLPIGSYQIKVPVPKNNIYTYNSYHNFEIKQNKTTEYSLVYKINTDNILTFDTELNLYGQTSGLLANIKFTSENIIVRSGGGYTHVVWPNSSNYAKVEILDLEDNVVLTKEYKGSTYASAGTDIIPYQIGYKVVVYHAEGNSNRYQIINKLTRTTPVDLNKVKGTNTYIIGKYGLYQTEDSYENYKNKVDAYAEKLLREIPSEDLVDKNKNITEKGILLASIYKLNEEDLKEYLEKYCYIYNGSAPKLLTTTITLNVGDSPDIYSLLKAADKEDGEFTLNSSNFSYDQFSTKEEGTYTISYTIQDLDLNKSTGTMTIIIEPKKDIENNDNNNSTNNESNLPAQSQNTDNINENKNDNDNQNQNINIIEQNTNSIDKKINNSTIKPNKKPEKNNKPSDNLENDKNQENKNIINNIKSNDDTKDEKNINYFIISIIYIVVIIGLIIMIKKTYSKIKSKN